MVQGFYFVLLQYSRIQAFAVRFVPLMQLYHQRHKTAYRTLQGLSLRLHPLNRLQYQISKNEYNAACATLERIAALGRPAPIPRYKTPRRTLYSSAQPPYYNKVYKGAAVRPVMDQCQTVQHSADHASPAGSAPTVCGSLASAAPGEPAKGSASPPGGTAQQQERGGRRGTIGGLRRISFRAFARWPIEVSNSRSVPVGIVVASPGE